MSSNRQDDNAPTPKLMQNIKDSITIIGGTTAIVAALLWLLGRQFAKGLYHSLGISPSQLNLSLWNYGEMGWKSLLFAVMLFGISFYAFFSSRQDALKVKMWQYRVKRILALVLLFTGLFAGVSTSLETIYLTPAISVFCAAGSIGLLLWVSTFPRGNSAYRPLVYFCAFGLALLVSFFSLKFASNSGANFSQDYATQQAEQVRVILVAPLLTGVPAITQTIEGGNVFFFYENVYLLEYNDGRYFLFHQVAPNCLPEQVFVVKESDLRSMDYTPSSSPRPQCVPITTSPPSSP